MSAALRPPGHRRLALLLLTAAACLVAAHLTARAAWARRPGGAPGAEVSAVAARGAAGEFASTLLLGGLRGLVSDMLWLRAVRANDAHRYYESVALYQVIATVQPRYVQAWEYMAHDLAWNIAAQAERRDEKWQWLLAGAQANADGVRRNPDRPRLLRHLAWMLFDRGERLADEVEAHDWRPLLDPALAAVGSRERCPPAGASGFRLAEILHRALAEVLARSGAMGLAAARRLEVVSVLRDGYRLRNRGEHRAALLRLLDAAALWATLAAWTDDAAAPLDDIERSLNRNAHASHGPRLERQIALLARLLAPDPAAAEALLAAVQQGDLAAARAQVGETWRSQRPVRPALWYDEAAP